MPLVLFVLVGLYLQLTDGFGDDGGGRFAVMGFMGLALTVVVTALKSLSPPSHPEQRGFPIEPRRPGEG